MRFGIGISGVKRFFRGAVGLLVLSLLYPVAASKNPPELFYFLAQACLSGGAFVLALLLAREAGKRVRDLPAYVPANLAVCAAAGTVVQAFFGVLPLVPALLFPF